MSLWDQFHSISTYIRRIILIFDGQDNAQDKLSWSLNLSSHLNFLRMNIFIHTKTNLQIWYMTIFIISIFFFFFYEFLNRYVSNELENIYNRSCFFVRSYVSNNSFCNAYVTRCLRRTLETISRTPTVFVKLHRWFRTPRGKGETCFGDSLAFTSTRQNTLATLVCEVHEHKAYNTSGTAFESRPCCAFARNVYVASRRFETRVGEGGCGSECRGWRGERKITVISWTSSKREFWVALGNSRTHGN